MESSIKRANSSTKRDGQTLPHADEIAVRPMDVEKIAGDQDRGEFGEALDWLGRPATERHGGQQTSVYILANQALWNVANYAVASNLVIYFNRVMQMSSATAANNVTNWTGTMYMCTLLGGFLGDCYLGRFWTCVIFQILHITGLVGISLSVTLDALKPESCAKAVASAMNCQQPSTLKTAVFFAGIYIIALGAGGYLPAFQALGADQIDSDIQKTNFFGWLFVATNVGTILATTLFVWMEDRGMWSLAYWLATGLGGLAFLVFCAGVPIYRQFRTSGNPFARVAQVVVAALRKWRLQLPADTNLLHEVDEEDIVLSGSRKMLHTSRFRFFDRAATKDGVDRIDEDGTSKQRWRLCTVTQVEEVKQLWRMLPIFLTAIPFAAISSQVTTLFVEEAAVMNTKVGGFDLPPAAMGVAGTLSIIVLTVLYPKLVVPAARRFTHKEYGLAPLQRMAVGILISSLAMAISALLESRRLHFAAQGKKLSVLWQTPQQVVMGAAMVFVIVGAMDFFYSEAPHAMRGIVTSLSTANLAVGNYVSTALVTLTVRFTKGKGKDGRASWIPADLNKGHLDYFFLLLFALSVFTAAFFVAGVWWYRRQSLPPPEPTDLAKSTHQKVDANY